MTSILFFHDLVNSRILVCFTLILVSACGAVSQRSLLLTEDKDSIHIELNDLPVLTYHKSIRHPPEGEPEYYQRSGFIHPLYNPRALVLTDDFPEGHMHQHGIFSAWVKTRFRGEPVDFWNQQNQTGSAAHSRILDRFDDRKSVGFVAEIKHRAFIGSDTVEALVEQWKVTVHDRDDPVVIDIRSDIRCAQSDTIWIDKYLYGGFAFRGSAEWNDLDFKQPGEGEPENFIGIDGQGGFLTDEGFVRIPANHSKPRWISFYGSIAGQPAGVTVIPHPENFRYPSPVRVHPVMPYFCFAPMVERGFYLAPGQTVISAYRILSHGPLPDKSFIERQLKLFSSSSLDRTSDQ